MNVGKLHISILMDHKTNLKGTLHFIFLNRLIFQLPKS